MNIRRIFATVLVLLALTTTLTSGAVMLSYEVEGDQLTVTLTNSGSADITVHLIAFESGQSLGSVTLTVEAESTSGAVFTITDELNPFEFAVASSSN